MAELTDAEIDAASKRRRLARLSQQRAASARYDSGRVVIDLTNGCTFSVPPRLAQGLEAATDEQPADIEILGAGYALHWEPLDVDLSVPGLLNCLLGTRAYMARNAG